MADQKSNKGNLTEGSINKSLIRLTIPMFFGMLSFVAFNLIDTYFVGKLGSVELAALSFTFPVVMVIFSLIQGIGIGATALISKSIGKGDRAKAARETTDSLILALAIGALFISLGLLFQKDIFLLLGAGEETIPYILEYMTIWFLAIFFVIVPFVGNSAIRSTGDARTPSLIMMFAVITNAILDPLLIFGYGPFPALGLKGAAIATAISRVLTLILSLYILYFREKLILVSFPTRRVIWGCWKAILFIGLPSGLSRLVTPLATGVVTAVLANYGESAVAAYGVGSRIEFLIFAFLVAISSSMGPFVGQNYGAGKQTRITTAVDRTSQFSVVYGFIMYGVMFLVAEPLASVFSGDPKVIEITVVFLHVIPISLGFEGVVQIINSTLNTLNKPLTASWLIVIQTIGIGIPLLLLLNGYGVFWIFASLAVMYALGGIISYAYYKRISKTLLAEKIKP